MLDVPISLFHSDDQRIIIVRVDVEGLLLEEDDINPCFLLEASREVSGYHICYKHMPYVFPSRRFRVTSTKKTFGGGVYVVGYDFIGHLWGKMEGVIVGVWHVLVLPGSHNGRHCTAQKE